MKSALGCLGSRASTCAPHHTPQRSHAPALSPPRWECSSAYYTTNLVTLCSAEQVLPDFHPRLQRRTGQQRVHASSQQHRAYLSQIAPDHRLCGVQRLFTNLISPAKPDHNSTQVTRECSCCSEHRYTHVLQLFSLLVPKQAIFVAQNNDIVEIMEAL